MARLRYIADNPRGPRGGNHDVRTLFSSAESASRNVLKLKGQPPAGKVLLVDLDELLVVKQSVWNVDDLAEREANFHADFDAVFAWHEQRWQHHGAEVLRLRPLADGLSREPAYLTTHDLARLREVVSEWDLEEDRLRRGGGATPAARGAFFVLRDLYREGKLGGRSR